MFCEENYLMWLSRVDGISLKKKDELIEYFGSAKNIFYASPYDIQKFCQSNRINFRNILDIKSENILETYMNELYKKKINFISKYNSHFPLLLKNIPDSPLGLYFLGDLPDEKYNKVGIVGARRCTQYGASNAYKFGKELAEKDIVIVSGMALGIDAMAHKGAIDANGKTIAVLGCGVDVVYPPSNSALRDRIIENGCVISEFPPSTLAFPAHFPMRNRIISGLSDAVIVVEAAKRSGTLITVGQALEQGRDVFAIPGNINNPMSQGTNDLIKDCAFPLTEVNDILQNLGICTKYSEKINEQNIEKEKKIIELLAPEEKLVYDCINETPITIDEIILKTNNTIQTIQYALTMLELKGYIKKLAGQKYIKNI